MTKVLIAEDDLSVCEMLRMFFQKERFIAVFVHEGLQAERLFYQESWDLVILDWMMPGKDGITLCKEFRASTSIPIILLTAKNEERDRIEGLELGADDYVTKPFSPLELIARMKAVLRRYKTGQGEANVGTGGGDDSIIRYRDIEINLQGRTVSIDSRQMPLLTPKEFDLFCLFVRHPKKVFTRDQLLESVWGFDYFGEERTVDVHIKRLRNKVSTENRPLIATVWGVGYKLEE